jgi:alginate O-acetyltransferase complex protein AlgJ
MKQGTNRVKSKQYRYLQYIPLVGFLVFFTLIGGLGLVTLITQDALPFWNMQRFIQGEWRGDLESEFEAALPVRDDWRSNWFWLQYGVFGQGLPGVVIGSDGWLFTDEEWEPLPTQPEFMVQTLKRARDHLRSLGMELLVVPLPAKNRIYQEFSGSSLDGDFAHRYSKFLQLLEDLEIPSVNLEQVFLETRQSNPSQGNQIQTSSQLFLRTDTHWTPLGAQVAAQQVARVVDSHGLVQSNQSWVFQSQVVEQQSYLGDLFGFLPSGNHRSVESNSDLPRTISLFQNLMKKLRPLPEADLIPTYETTMVSGPVIGLFDTPEIPVVLVGTSYSAGEAWNFPGFLQEAMGLDLVSFAQEGLGPWQPMIQALENPSLTELGVQLVIWEIPIRFVPVNW